MEEPGTDYFPGLGWMIRNETWKAIKDEWPRFPSTGRTSEALPKGA